MEVIWTKVLALSIMMVISVAVGLLPLKVRKWIIRLPNSEARSQIFLSASLCFGAGVLLGTVFLHLLPETLGDVDAAMAGGYITDSSYPIGELILCSGFFFMYILEELVHGWVHRNQDSSELPIHQHHHHNLHGHNDHEIFAPTKASNTSPSPDHKSRRASEHQGPSSPCRNKRRRCESLPTVAVLVGCNNPVICADPHTSCTAIHEEPSIGSENAVHIEPIALKESTKTLRSVLVILALSVHGCLEGLSLGLEDANKDVWMMFLALSAHKIPIAFSIGMELLEKGVKFRSYVTYIIMFSLASPLGGLIGALIKEYSSTETAAGVITIMILQGLSGGTIMFVVFCEVLERERSKTDGRLSRLVALILGFTLMGCLELVNAGGHEHVNSGETVTTYIQDLQPLNILNKRIALSIISHF